jgi:pSer/pThr/pTyr-binding forkhead associated (FHA) protein
MDKTLSIESSLGKRLNQIKKFEERSILFKGKEIPLVSKITIGRDPGNNIVLKDKMVSRFHAEIQKIKEDFFVKDMSSSNGTYVNDLEIPQNKYARLQEKDKIRIGKTELIIT